MFTLLDRWSGQASPYVVNAVTPLWIVAVGLLLGLIACALVGAIAWGMSRLPGLGQLPENPAKKWTSIGLLFCILVAPVAMLFRLGGPAALESTETWGS